MCFYYCVVDLFDLGCGDDGFDPFFFDGLQLTRLTEVRVCSRLTSVASGTFDGERTGIVIADVSRAAFGQYVANFFGMGGGNVDDEFVEFG